MSTVITSRKERGTAGGRGPQAGTSLQKNFRGWQLGLKAIVRVVPNTNKKTTQFHTNYKFQEIALILLVEIPAPSNSFN